jgi:signal transduction histidine kinase
MYRDITQDLNLQRQVIESAKLAELGTISSSIAHELNNPIGGMLNFLQLIKMDLTGEEDYYPDLEEIERGIIKCKEIVKNLLGFSRRSVDAQRTDVDLVEVIEQAIKITELKTRSVGIKIHFQRPERSPQIQGRFNLLTHAIRNLLQNSQESLLEERRKNRSFRGEIRISVRETAKTIEIGVSDNGPGIPPQHRDKIFDPLYTTKDPETNSGLGLTLAQQIVREHNGEILLSSDNEENLTLRISLNKPQVQS